MRIILGHYSPLLLDHEFLETHQKIDVTPCVQSSAETHLVIQRHMVHISFQ
jgi:hypothetical protein